MSWLMLILFLAALFYFAYVVRPFLLERSYARSLFQYIDGRRPHWLFGHLQMVRFVVRRCAT